MENKTNTFNLDGHEVTFIHCIKKSKFKDLCLLCNKVIGFDDKVVMCYTDPKLFPITMIHEKCISGVPNKVTAIVLRDKWKKNRLEVKP